VARDDKDIKAIAQKQRHLALLKKVRDGKTLSISEIAELERYEAEGKKNSQSSIVKRKSSKRYLSLAQAQRLGYECGNIAEADKVSGLSSNLSKYFERHPKVRASFDRGRLLKYLVELAPNTDIHNAARKLKQLGFSRFEKGQDLRDFLDSDAEADELWETARVNGEIDNWKWLRQTAADGNVRAIQLLDKWTVDRQQEKGMAGGVNFKRVPTKLMAELFGTTRQTIHDWWTSKGLSQNLDGSFDLYRVIPWFEDYTLKKAVRGKEAVGPLNPFQAVKTERERLRLEQDRGELIERGVFIAWRCSILQSIVNAFNALPDLANRVFAQSREEIVARLEDFRDEIMAKLQHVPTELRLSEEANEKLMELYELIKPMKTKNTGHRTQDTEYRIQDTEHRTQNTE